MRNKDENKQEAVIEATIKLVNEIGFVSSSVAKIAKEAGVSPATIYVYYENKEDLLSSTYLAIKKKLSEYMLDGFDKSLPVRDILETLWKNTFKYVKNNAQQFIFAEQFSNSPYSDLVNKDEVEGYFLPLISVLQEGVEKKILKDVHPEILATFIFYPVITLSNKRLCKNIVISDELIEQSFQMAWDAIKL
jgi:AcrR family transcriptional regulator